MKRVAILGSTGSIGRQALEIIARHPHRFNVVALAAGANADLLKQQTHQFKPEIVSLRDEGAAGLLAVDCAVAWGARGLERVAAESGADIVLAATDGFAAFDAVFAAVARGIDIAVANKELIVAAGELLFAAARAANARILPVDSEHSGLFQTIAGERPEDIARLVLTASGGPFRDLPAEALLNVSVQDALRHPTWQMGVKNTVDSATLMNKGLEVIEASRFFDIAGDRIDVLVHRTSVAHAFAIFRDGSVKAQISPPDMQLPIGYALSYPERLPDRDPATLDALTELGAKPGATETSLAFERPDMVRFPSLALAYAALATGGIATTVLSAANEIAVEAFVRGDLRFTEIPALVERALSAVPQAPLGLDAVREADRLARAAASRGLVRTHAVS